MALNSLGLGLFFTATDLASGVMDNIKQNFVGLSDIAGKTVDGLDGMVRKLGAGLTMTAAGVGGLAATFGLAGQAGKFETSMKEIQRVTFGTEEKMKELETQALKMGPALGQSPRDAAQAMRLLATAGYDTAQILELVPKVLKFASTNLLSVEDATTITGQALKGFGIDVSLTGYAMDQMQLIANATAMDVGDLRIAFSRLSGGVHSTQGSLTDALTVFGLTKNAISSTQLAATASSLAFERLANPKVLEMMRGIGVAVLDQNHDFKKIPEVLADVYEKYQKLGGAAEKSSFLEKAFGRDAKKGVESLFAQLAFGMDSKLHPGIKLFGKEAIMDMHDFIAQANGTLDEAAKIFMDRYEGTKAQLWASVEAMMIRLGQPFMHIWRPILNEINQLVNSFADYLRDANPAVLDFGAAVIIGGFGLLTLSGIIGTLNAAMPLFTTGLSLLAQPFKNLGIAAVESWQGLKSLSSILMSPSSWKPFIAVLWDMAAGAVASAAAFWPLYLAAAAIGVVAYAISENIGGMGDMWDRVVKAFKNSGFLDWLSSVGSYFMTLLSAAKEGFSGVLVFMKPWFEVIASTFNHLMDAFSQLGAAFGMLGGSSGPGGLMIALFKSLGGIVGFVATNFVTMLAAVVELVSWIVKAAASITKFLAPAFLWVKSIIESVIGAFQHFIESFGWFKGLFHMAAATTPAAAAATATATIPQMVAAEVGAAPGAAPPAAPPAASIAALGTQEGWASKNGGPPPRVDIDYEKMAAANRATPLILSIDGHQVGEILRNAETNDRLRSGLRPEPSVR